MSMWERVYLVVLNLTEIVLACLPVFCALLFLEWLGDKLGSVNPVSVVERWAERKLAKDQAAERKRWADRGHDLDKRN